MIIILLGYLVIGGTSGARLKRIVGGEDIEIIKVPYQASIRSDDYHICGGSLISSRHVLTAAHCVFNLFEQPYDELTVVTGAESLKNGGNVHNVRNIKWHDDFRLDEKAFWVHDIAVITLAANVTQNEKQKAILLPIRDAPMNVTGIVSGFGRTVSENPYMSLTLQRINVTILPSNACKRFAINNKILDTQICGKQSKGVGICKGDSGGPLAYNNTIVGVASWNVPHPCGSGTPDVYTNVYHYLDFIKKLINRN